MAACEAEILLLNTAYVHCRLDCAPCATFLQVAQPTCRFSCHNSRNMLHRHAMQALRSYLHNIEPVFKQPRRS